MKSSPLPQTVLWLAVMAVWQSADEPAIADAPAVEPLITLAQHEYCIGVACSPLNPALRTQANLPQDRGIVVARVVPGSPAEKAGLKQYDVVVEAGGRPLTGLRDLIDAVQRNHDKEIPIEVIRSGEHMSLVVTPEKHRKCTRILVAGKMADRKGADQLQEWVGRLETQREGQGAFDIESFRPGVIVSRVTGQGNETESPKGLRITITEKREDPTTIKLEQGDESWEVTDAGRGKLNTLIILCGGGETDESSLTLECTTGYFVYRANVHVTDTKPRFGRGQ